MAGVTSPNSPGGLSLPRCPSKIGKGASRGYSLRLCGQSRAAPTVRRRRAGRVVHGLNYATPSNVAIAYENPAEMKDGINLLFADGHVEFREMRWAAETVRRSLAYPRRGDPTWP